MLNYWSLLTFAVLFIFGTLAENFLNHGKIRDDNGSYVLINDIKKIERAGWARILIPALVVSVIDFFVYKASSTLWVEWIFFFLVIAALVFYVAMFVRDGDRLRELVVFIPLFVMSCVVLFKVGKVIAPSIESAFWANFVSAPWVIFIFGVGIPIAAFLLKGGRKVLAGILAVLMLFSVIALIVHGVSADRDNIVDSEDIQNLTVRKLTVEELEKLALNKFSGISEELLGSSLSIYDKERVNETGFSDALTFGFSNKKADKMFEELEEEILRNPIYGITVANAIKDKKVGSQEIGSFNPWMKEMVAKNEKGLVNWIEYRDDSGVIYVTDEYRCYAATLCIFLERLVNQGVITKQTVENWCLSLSVEDNVREGVKADYQYKKEALVFTYIGKNGAELFTIGFNIHDKRPEFFKDTVSSDSSKGGGTGGGGSEPTTTKPGPEPTTKSSGKKNPADDPVNNGNAQKGGGQNKSSDGSGEYQPDDPRKTTTTPTYPQTPPGRGNTVDHEKKMDYTTDPASNRGPANGGSPNPSTGDGANGEFTPGD